MTKMATSGSRRQLRVNSSRLGRDDDEKRPFRPTMGGLPQGPTRSGALGGNDTPSGPTSETLNIQRLLNPGFQPGLTPRQLAESRMRRGDLLPGVRYDPRFAERDRRASAAARASRTDRDRNKAFRPPVEEMPDFRSFADYLREAEAMLGGGDGISYDPQRNALRQNTAQANDIIGSIYANLQQQFADSAPQIQQRYAQTGEGIDLNTAQAANAVNSSNTAIRDEQTRQLAALGIEDAIANVAPQQAADQANALQSIERTGQLAGNQNEALGASARTYNDENRGTAGMEGASKRAMLQANLLSALADVDAREQEANRSLASQRQGSALSVAQLLMENDPEGARAAAAQAQQMRELAQQQFENEMSVREFDAKYGSGRAQPGLGLQQVMDLLAQQGLSPDKTDPKNYAALLNAYSRYL